MSAVDHHGVRVSLLEHPEPDDAFWRTILVCDRCARVRDLRDTRESEESWIEQAAFLAKTGLSYADAWWCHTICRACLAAAERPTG